MARYNLFELMKRLTEVAEEQGMTDGAYRMYVTLVMKFNTKKWPESIRISNALLADILATSPKRIKRAKVELREVGLLNYEEKHGITTEYFLEEKTGSNLGHNLGQNEPSENTNLGHNLGQNDHQNEPSCAISTLYYNLRHKDKDSLYREKRDDPENFDKNFARFLRSWDTGLNRLCEQENIMPEVFFELAAQIGNEWELYHQHHSSFDHWSKHFLNTLRRKIKDYKYESDRAARRADFEASARVRRIKEADGDPDAGLSFDFERSSRLEDFG